MEVKQSSLILSKWTSNLLGAKMNYRLRYFHQRGHFPNLKTPKDLSEILIKQMFDPFICANYAPFIDKLTVRDYLRQKGLGSCLLKHYGVWNRPEDVSKLNQIEAVCELHRAVESGISHIEPHYHCITPRLFAEELIETEDGGLPVDYKFTCINGEIMDIFVATDRDSNTHYCTLDTNWAPLPYTKKNYLPKQLPSRPSHLDNLIEVAHILSKDFHFVRVDLYEYHDRPFFSELTFFPWGGLLYSYTDEAIRLYGEKWRTGALD